MTHEGAAYYARCQHILSQIEEADETVGTARHSPRGRLRIDVNVTLATHFVVPVLPGFIERYPDVQVELHHTEHTFDVAHETFDVLIRMGKLRDSDLIARPIATFPNLTAASPAYLKRHGEPKEPKELLRHDCIGYIDPHRGNLVEWIFQRNGRQVSLETSGHIACNQGVSRIVAAIAGAGVVQASSPELADAIRRGQLKRILRDWEARQPQVSLAYQRNRYLPAKAKAFVEYMRQVYPPGT